MLFHYQVIVIQREWIYFSFFGVFGAGKGKQRICPFVEGVCFPSSVIQILGNLQHSHLFYDLFQSLADFVYSYEVPSRGENSGALYFILL